jgi:uncharacterized protein YeaO (DUF488 family)
LWPRGVAKAKLRIEAWLKDVAPTTELRSGSAHDPDKWDEFRKQVPARARLASRGMATDCVGRSARSGHADLQRT